MAISRFSTSSVAQGLPKYQKIWDQTSFPVSPYNGYIFGGYNGSANVNTTVKMNFLNETVSTLGSTLTIARGATAVALNNNGVAAYAFAGDANSASNIMTMDKLTYSTDTISSSVSGPSGQGRNYAGAMDNTATAGYVGGGESGTSLVYFTNYLKFTFSSATWTTGSNVSLETNSHTGSENGSTAGYHWGNVGGSYTTARKVTFSNDSWSNSFTHSVRLEYSSHAPSNGTVACYQFGGQDGSTGNSVSQIGKVTYSGESFSTLSATLSSARRLVATLSNWSTAAYACGGTNISPVNTIQKLTFSGETMSTLSATLPYSLYANASTSNHV